MNRFDRGWPFAFLFALISFPPECRPDTPPTPDVDEVRRKLAVRDSVFQNVGFVATYHDHNRALRHGPFADKDRFMSVLLDTSPGVVAGPIQPLLRVKVDVTESADAQALRLLPAGQKSVRWEAVYSPKSSVPFRKLELGIQRKPDGAKIQVPLAFVDKESMIPWLCRPEKLLGLCGDSPSVILSDPATMMGVEGMEDIDGHLAVRITWAFDTSRVPANRVFRGLIWVAPALGYAVVRREDSRRPKPDQPWRPIERIECKDFSSVNGLWVPSKVTFVRHNYHDDGGYELVRELVATFEKWVVNQPLRDEMFRLDFPDGTQVVDSIRGVNYEQGRISQASLERQIAAVKKLAADAGRSRRMVRSEPVGLETQRQPLPENTPPGLVSSIATSGIAGALILGLAFALLRYRKTRQERGA